MIKSITRSQCNKKNVAALIQKYLSFKKVKMNVSVFIPLAKKPPHLYRKRRQISLTFISVDDRPC